MNFAELYERIIDLPVSSRWARRIIRRDFALSNREQIQYLPTSLIEQLIFNKIITNIEWENEHLEWLRDNTTKPFIVQERIILFVSDDDMAMFLLKFQDA